MSKLPRDQQTALLEANVGKIDKALQMLLRDAKKMPDILDAVARDKLATYLHARVNDMITDLGKAKRAVFSLDAPLENPCKELLQLPGVAVAIPADQIIDGSLTAVPAPAPTPSVPQPQTDEDDELAAIAALDETAVPTPPKAPPVTYDMAPPPAPDPTKPPAKWRKPTGRLVGTKEPVWIETEPPRAAGDEPTEKPDATGYIKDAGFLEAE